VAFTPDDRFLASVGGDGVIRFWDRVSGAQDRIASGQGRTWCVAFSSDGRNMATTSADATVTLWDSSTDRGWVPIPYPGEYHTPSKANSRDGTSLVVSDGAGNIWSYETHSGHLMSQQRIGAPGSIHLARLSHDASQFVSFDKYGTVALWDLASGQRLRDFPVKAMSRFALAFSPGGEWIAGGRSDQGVFIWRTDGGPPTQVPKRDAGDSIVFSPSGECSIWGRGTPGPYIFDPDSGRSRVATRPGHRLSIAAEAFSPDGRTLATAGDGPVILWDALSLDPLLSLYGPPGDAYSVAFSPDGRTLAVGGFGHILLWDLASRTLIASLEGHSGAIFMLVFSPDGRSLASGADLIRDGRHRIQVILWPAGPREAAAVRASGPPAGPDSRKNHSDPR
jgi:WD40 repeat protein